MSLNDSDTFCGGKVHIVFLTLSHKVLCSSDYLGCGGLSMRKGLPSVCV